MFFVESTVARFAQATTLLAWRLDALAPAAWAAMRPGGRSDAAAQPRRAMSAAPAAPAQPGKRAAAARPRPVPCATSVCLEERPAPTASTLVDASDVVGADAVNDAPERAAFAVAAGDPRRLRRCALRCAHIAVIGLAVVVTLACASFAALVANHSYWAADYPPAFWHSQLDRMLRPAVFDAAGELVGFLPPPGANDLDAAHAAAPLGISEDCVDLVVAREDRHAGECDTAVEVRASGRTWLKVFAPVRTIRPHPASTRVLETAAITRPDKPP